MHARRGQYRGVAEQPGLHHLPLRVYQDGPAARVADRGVQKKIMLAYREPGVLGDYELDHLVSLVLGGSNDAGNLWPERNDHPAGAINSKDLVENALNKAVCSHTVTLAAAQAAIATDWTTALATLGLPALHRPRITAGRAGCGREAAGAELR